MKCKCESEMYPTEGVWVCPVCGDRVKHECVIDLKALGIEGEAAETFRKSSADLCAIFEKYFPSGDKDAV